MVYLILTREPTTLHFPHELNRTALIERVAAYPDYVQLICGVSIAEFAKTCVETPEAEALPLTFTRHCSAG